MRYSRTVVAASAIAVLAMSGCTVSAPSPTSADTQAVKGKSLTIGFSMVTQQSPFYVQLKQGAEEAAQKAGDKLLFVDANGDVNKQNNDVQDLITRGIRALIIDPVDPKGVAPSIAAAKAAHIPLISVDRPVNAGQMSFVGRNNVEMGKLVGQALAKALGSAGGQVIEIQGDPGGAVARDRGNGFAEGVAANKKIQVIKGPYANYIRAQAVSAMQDLLQAHPNVKAVYAENDDMAMGALQVLEESHRTDVKVAGIDGLMEAVKQIADGNEYVATALNDPIYEGQLAVQTAIAAARGQKVPAYVDAGTALIDHANAGGYVGSSIFARIHGQ